MAVAKVRLKLDHGPGQGGGTSWVRLQNTESMSTGCELAVGMGIQDVCQACDMSVAYSGSEAGVVTLPTLI